MDRILLANWIMCPDGTMLPSFHTHDFRTRKDDMGRISTVDGGRDYLRRAGEYTEISVYSDDPYEVIRRFVCRGSRGVNGDEPLHYIPLYKMSNEHLVATIKYNNDNNIDSIYQKYYYQELTYRSYDYNIQYDKNQRKENSEKEK